MERIPVALTDITNPYIRQIRALPFLQRATCGDLGHAMWLRWARERYHASQYFIMMCEAIVTAARDELHDERLAAVVAENVHDEKGTNGKNEGAHEDWRINFYNALGTMPEILKAPTPPLMTSTEFYPATLRRLIEEKDVFALIGALLFLEVTLPHEFTLLLNGLEREFPEKFSIAPHDGGETPDKLKARKYLADHIYHDAAHHAKDLFHALIPYAQDTGIHARLDTGCAAIMEAKRRFYRDLEALAMGDAIAANQ